MSYRLVIAEKPSVGAAYAKVLGATNRQDGYWGGYSDENTCYNIAMAQVSVAQEGKLPEMH